MRNPFDVAPRSRLVFAVVLVLLGLGAFYWFRTEQNRARLSQRNLRDLARIARAIEAKANNLEQIVEGLKGIDRLPSDARRSRLELAREQIPHALKVSLVQLERERPRQFAPPMTCSDLSWTPEAERALLWLHANGTSLCVEYAGEEVGAAGRSALVFEFDLVGLLQPAMRSSFFEEIFLADEEGRVVLQARPSAQRLRQVPPPMAPASDLESAPAPSRSSAAYETWVGGRDFVAFLQPVDLSLLGPRTGPATGDGGEAVGTLQPTRWQVGGLVDAARFRSEGLALDPGKLSILLVLVVFTILAWPFLKLWSMGGRERVTRRDVLFLGFSFVLGSGIVAICVFDLAFFWRLNDTFDAQLADIGEQMAANVHTEIGLALDELDTLSYELDRELREAASELRPAFAGAGIECRSVANRDGRPPDGGTDIYGCLAQLTESSMARLDTAADNVLEESPLARRCLPITPRVSFADADEGRRGDGDALGEACRASGPPPHSAIGTRFPYFDMAIWVNRAGFQVVKWSPNPDLTPRRSVAHREYFQTVKAGQLWRRIPLQALDDDGGHTDDGEHDHGSEGARGETEYFLEVIRSINTGEILVVLSKPFQIYTTTPATLDGWAATMTAKLASLDQPVLPPGFGFAVIDGDGRALFHSIPEQGLEGNFFEEADDDPGLRSTVIARAEGHRSLRYLGRDIRLYLTPIGGSPLSLIVYQDRAYPRTIAFETMAIALTFFGAFVLLLVLFALGAQVGFSRRLSWAWPGGDQEAKHRILLLLFAILAVASVAQALVLIDVPTVDRYLARMLASTYLIALLAVAATLIVLAERPAQSLLGLLLAVVAGGLLVFSLEVHWWVAVVLASAGLAGWLLYRGSRKRPAIVRRLPVRRWLGRNLYPLTMLGGLLVVGTLPAALSFAIIAADHMELLVKDTQLHAVEDLRRRDLRLRAEYAPPDDERRIGYAVLQGRRDGLTGDGIGSGVRVTPFDVLVGAAFETCYRPPSLYQASSSMTDWYCGPGPHEEPSRHASHWRKPEVRPQDPLVHGLLDKYLPFFTDVSVEMRHLYHDHPTSIGDGGHDHHGPLGSEGHLRVGPEDGVPPTAHDYDRGWWWSVHEAQPEDRGVDAARAGGEPILLSAGPPQQSYAVFSTLPEGFGLPQGPLWWLGLLAGLVGLFYLIRLVARQVFLVDLDPPEAVRVKNLARGKLTHSSILVTPWEGDRDLLRERKDVALIDLRELLQRGGDDDIELDLPSKEKTLLIDGLDTVLDEPAWSERLLVWMEELQLSGRRMVLEVDRDPDDILFRSELTEPAEGTPEGRADSEAGSGTTPNGAARTRHRERWGRLLSSFTKVIAGRPSPIDEAYTTLPGGARWQSHLPWKSRPESDARDRNERLLQSECAITAALQPVKEQVERHPQFGRLSDEALTHMVRDAAEGQYRRIWNSLSEEEMITLAQIADGAVSLPKRSRTVADLLSRGLLERRPDLRLMNRSFTHFVREVAPPERIAAWEAEGETSAWQALRQPLFIALVATALFLFVTQRDLFNTGLAFVTAVAAGVPSLFRLLGSVRPAELRR